MKLIKIISLTLLGLFVTDLISAQSINPPEYETKGFFAKLSLFGTAWTIDDIDVDAESGGGLGANLGYNFTSNFGLFASFDAASMQPEEGEDYLMGHLDLGLQGIFRSSSDRFRPYLRVSLLGMSAQYEELDLEINGGGIGLGAGGLIFLSENLALDINYTHGLVNITEFKIGSTSEDLDERATTARLFIGLAYHF
jgi:opacity protein-like surface antigen